MHDLCSPGRADVDASVRVARDANASVFVFFPAEMADR